MKKLLLLPVFALTAWSAYLICNQQTTQISTQSQATTKSTGKVIILSSEAQFDELIKQGNVVVDFFAPWCGPCRRISPILDQLAAENLDIIIVKVNVDDFPGLSSRFGISGIPMLILFKNGTRAGQIGGAKSKAEYTRVFNQTF